MKFITREQLEALEDFTVNASCKSRFTLREVVEKSYSTLKKMRAHRMSWQEISVLLAEAVDINASSHSLAKHFYRVTAQKKQKQSQRKLATPGPPPNQASVGSQSARAGDRRVSLASPSVGCVRARSAIP